MNAYQIVKGILIQLNNRVSITVIQKIGIHCLYLRIHNAPKRYGFEEITQLKAAFNVNVVDIEYID